MKTKQKIKNLLLVFAIALGVVTVLAFSNDTTVNDQDTAYAADLYQNQSNTSTFALDLGKCGDDKKAEKEEKKCGEGKCGEGKCGGDEKKAEKAEKCGGDDKKAEKAEKCGEGKCGGDEKKAEKCDSGKCGEGKCGGEKKEKKAEKEKKCGS